MSRNVTIVWLDQAPTPDHITYTALCKIDPYLITFRDSNECIDYIVNLHEAKNRIVLIVTYTDGSTYSDIMLQRSEELIQVESVYILYNQVTMNDETLALSNNSRQLYTELNSLCSQLKQRFLIDHQHRKRFREAEFTISCLPQPNDTTPAILTTTSKTIEEQEAEFMYGELLRNILIDMDSSQAEMIEFCREKNAENESYLNAIKQFETYYKASDPVLWYTKNTFLYRQLNKAFREQDISALYALRYFIKDLHLQLRQLCDLERQNICSSGKIYTVYRGQLMDSEEFDKKINTNAGGFFSVNGFLSTTRNRNLALEFYAGNSREGGLDKTKSILFEIDIDTSINKFVIADISQQSQFGAGEEEILFTMGSVFRIQSIQHDDRDTWVVRLQLTEEEDENLRNVREVLKRTIEGTSKPLVRLLRLIRTTGKYNEVEHFASLAMQDTSIISCDNSLADIHNILGMTYTEQQDFSKAVKSFDKALTIRLKLGSPTNPYLAPLYANLGVAYKNMRDFKNALASLSKALNLKLNVENKDYASVATTYASIGSVYNDQSRFQEALEMYTKSLEIESKILPPNHPSLAITLTNIGLAFYNVKCHDEAINYYERALKIQKASLPSMHPIIADTYRFLGLLYDVKKQISKALDCFRKAKDILSENLSSDHRKMKSCEEWIEQLETARFQ